MMESNTGASSAAATVYTDFNGLARLRHAAQGQETSPETVRKVAQQFEALFLQMMLKNMRNTGVEDKLFGSDQEQMYRDMFDQQLSVDLSEKGALGLADLLVRQLTHQPATSAPSIPAAASRSLPVASPAAVSSMSLPVDDEAGSVAVTEAMVTQERPPAAAEETAEAATTAAPATTCSASRPMHAGMAGGWCPRRWNTRTASP